MNLFIYLILLFGYQTTQLKSDKLIYLELSGTPYERGFTHGSQLKDKIHELVKKWEGSIEFVYKMPAADFVKKFVNETNFIKDIEKDAPDLLAEVHGIADGSEIDFETIYAFQLIDEMWFNGEQVMAHKCTCLSVKKNGIYPTLASQNLDIPEFYHGYQTVLKIKENGLESFIVTVPGLIAATGMNNQSVSINVNTLAQLAYGSDGLPVAFIVRKVLQQKNYNDALNFIKRIRHASGQNYTISDKNNTGSFECSYNQVNQFEPFAGASFTYHTNHPLINSDYSKKYLSILEKKNKTVAEGLYICYRFASLQQRFNQETTGISIEQIKDVLRSKDHPDKWNISNKLTFAAVIYELGNKPILHISPGNPYSVPFQKISFESDIWYQTN